MASLPESRIMAIAPAPEGVAKATMVWCGIMLTVTGLLSYFVTRGQSYKVFMEAQDGEEWRF